MPYRTTRKMALRKRTHRKTLILAAIQLFAQRGYHATTVRMIAKAARSSNGGSYYYFRGKDDVCAVILELFADAIARALHAAVASTTAGKPQQLHSAVGDLVLLMTGNPDVARILILESSSALDARIEKIRRDVTEQSVGFFAQLLTKWATPPLDCAVAARCILGSVYESIRHWLELPPEQRPAPQDLATAVADFTSRAIAAPQPQASC
jgi:AcrR family transcriptional regulator